MEEAPTRYTENTILAQLKDIRDGFDESAWMENKYSELMQKHTSDIVSYAETAKILEQVRNELNDHKQATSMAIESLENALSNAFEVIHNSTAQ